ncbi:MAG TPA: hypothetical protein VMM60_12955 [Ilumatobacter sp.]|nr:hypothetical protein [Ilumatobacter sp.]
MPLPQLRSPFARAVVPVLGGIAVLALLGGFLWAMAAFISSGGSETSNRFAPSIFPVGQVEGLAASVAEDGPLFFPELGTAVGERSIVVDHTGDVPADNWRIYWAYPADRDATCVVEQVPTTRTFIDCDGRTIDVTDLAPPDEGVFPRVEDRRTLVLDLRGITATTSITATTTATTAG